MFYIIIFLLGLIIGSFITALTDRWPREESIITGRSHCPKCKKQIAWYDNIPLFSYLLLKGKCRNCNKKISIRYPLIEFSTGMLFLLAGFYYINFYNTLYFLRSLDYYFGLLSILFLFFLFIAIFVIDLENQYIPDRLTFWGLGLIVFVLLFTHSPILFQQLLVGLTSSLFLLVLHIITKGRGMGLGDVKLVLFIGILFTPLLAILWISLSFIIGSIVGVGLIILGKAKLQQQIAFGPFLISSALIIIFFGNQILNILVPYII